MRVRVFALVAGALVARAVGLPQVVTFEGFGLDFATLPIVLDPNDSSAVHIAAESFENDLNAVTGKCNGRYNDTRLINSRRAILVGTVDSSLIRRVNHHRPHHDQQMSYSSASSLSGQWESFDIRVVGHPLDGLDEALVITGSDRRGVIFGLYTLSEQVGVSPWVWWSDVSPMPRDTISFPRHEVLRHGEPTVKYRGLFINDEQPALWNWAKERFNTGDAPFQVGMYAKLFELVLRLKGNYLWPAMWAAMFDVDGLNDLPDTPIPGPNQALAERMGIVMGTSHHEPMARNTLEWVKYGSGPWSFEKNSDLLKKWWKYGAERAKGLETLFTVGMRGNGDLPLEEAGVEMLENITATQQEILRSVYSTTDLSGIPQVWAMYKEVMGFFGEGLEVPREVTPLLSDDNWGNLMAVMPNNSHKAGGGIYYHVDYVGDPRDYKWINTAPLTKMWEQLNIAQTLDTKQIWILNVGDLKFVEIPAEYFLTLAYDFEVWSHDSLVDYLSAISSRDFGTDDQMSKEVGEIMATYSLLASRRKAELIDSSTFSLVNYEEDIHILSNWTSLRDRAQVVQDGLAKFKKAAFWQLVLLPIHLQLNLNDLYISAAKSNLYVTQGRSSTNVHADYAKACLERDADYTDAFDHILGGKWNNTLSQPHFNYQYWQSPVRESMPPISYVSSGRPTYAAGDIIHTRYIPENSFGAWPGDNKYNCPLGYSCDDPVLLPMDRFGRDRWVDVASGGPLDVDFTVSTSDPWLIASPSSGHITSDGKNDVRVYISVDWDAVANLGAPPTGSATFTSSDGATTVVTIPLNHAQSPPDHFHGAVEGDGYIAVEAEHYQANTATSNSSWSVLPYYGRTLSALTPLPVIRDALEFGSGPSVTYNLWFTSTPVNNTLNATILLGPSLNFFLGKRLEFGISLDDGDIVSVKPVPEAGLGKLPSDWEEIMRQEARYIKVALPITRNVTGEHRITLWGVTSGIVIQRLLIDFGGIKNRGHSYLGPPESIIA